MEFESGTLIASLVVGCLAALGVWAYIDYAESNQEAAADERKHHAALKSAEERKNKVRSVVKVEAHETGFRSPPAEIGLNVGEQKRAGVDVPIPGAGGSRFRN